MDDWQLIQNYVEQKSEPAFSTLTNRYIALVHSAALRQVGDSHLAEEVTQAVFILLAKKSDSFRSDIILPGWLFRTTRFVASRAVRSEQRRRQREQEAYEMQQLNSPETAWLRMSPHLDEALAQLGEADRNAIILRYFQGQELRQVGLALGMSEEAARKRVSRGIEKLRSIFAQRGYSISASLIITILGSQTMQAIPAGLSTSVAATALAAGTTSAAAFPLVLEALTAWHWAKVKLVGLSAVGGVALFVLVFVAFLESENKKTKSEMKPMAISELAANVSSTNEDLFAMEEAAPPIAKNESVLRFRVLAADNDEPVSNTRLAVNTVAGTEWKRRFDLSTDSFGWCNVPYPSGIGRLDVGVFSPGWSARFATWMPSREDSIPAEYTLRVERITNSVGGFLTDSAGLPVSGAEVLLMFWGGGDASNREMPRERLGFVGDSLPVAISDVNGQWTAAVIPARHEGFQLEATHPDFAKSSIASCSWNPPSEDWQKEKLNRLWSGTLMTVMHAGYTLKGRVVTEAGAPIPGAKITEAIQSPIFETDKKGFFEIRNLEEDQWEFTVSAEGYAPKRLKVNLERRRKPLEIQLKTGAILRLLIVDENEAPVPGAIVGLEQWGTDRHVLEWTAKSDSEGRIEWRSAPPKKELELYARKDGFCTGREISLKATGEEHRIRLQREFTVSGVVLDSETSEPIGEFKAIPGYTYSDTIGWERSDARRRSKGEFTLTFNEDRRPWHVRIEAEGYLPAVSDPISPNFDGTLEFALEKENPSEAVRGVVLLPNGLPAPDTQVVLLGLENNALVSRGAIRSDNAQWLVTTDSEGRFSFPVNPLGHTVAAVHEGGICQVRVPDPRQPITVQLQRWGKIEGRIEGTAKEKPIRFIEWNDPTTHEYQGQLQFNNFISCSSVADGKFKFDLVPPGEWKVAINSGPGTVIHHKTFVKVLPGETAQVVLTTRGPIVKGRLMAGNLKKPVADLQTMIKQRNRLVPSDIVAQMRNVDFWQSAAGIAHLKESYSIRLIVDAEGNFVSEDEVPPGDYRLRVRSGKGINERIVSIPSEYNGTEVDLGTVVEEE